MRTPSMPTCIFLIFSTAWRKSTSLPRNDARKSLAAASLWARTRAPCRPSNNQATIVDAAANCPRHHHQLFVPSVAHDYKNYGRYAQRSLCATVVMYSHHYMHHGHYGRLRHLCRLRLCYGGGRCRAFLDSRYLKRIGGRERE